MRYLSDIPGSDYSRATIYFDMQGIFHFVYCKPGAAPFGPFYEKRFYYCNKRGAHYILHNGRRYYSKYNLQYT
jgi:hypothetical protein